MSALLLTFLLASSVFAQSGPPPNGGGHSGGYWKITMVDPGGWADYYKSDGSSGSRTLGGNGHLDLQLIPDSNNPSIFGWAALTSEPIVWAFDWSDPLSQPDHDVYIRETISAAFSVNGTGTADVDGGADCLVDFPVTTIPANGTYTDMQGNVTGYYKSVLQFGTHVTHKINPSRHFEMSGKPFATILGTVRSQSTAPYTGWAWCGISGSYQVALDDRGVQIVRLGAHDEYVDDNAVTHGDTTYAYNTQAFNLFGQLYSVPVPNNQWFRDSRSGFWISPGTGTWNSSFSNTLQYDNSSADHWDCDLDIPFGNPRLNIVDLLIKQLPSNWLGSATGPQSGQIDYTLVDAYDGASATSSYILTVHDKYEQVDISHAYTTNTFFTGETVPPIAGVPTSIQRTLTPKPQIGFEVSNPEFGKWLPIVNYTVNYIPTSNTYTLSYGIVDPKFFVLGIFEKDSIKTTTFKYFEYDTGGQVLADPSDRTVKSTATAVQTTGCNFFLDKMPVSGPGY